MCSIYVLFLLFGYCISFLNAPGSTITAFANQHFAVKSAPSTVGKPAACRGHSAWVFLHSGTFFPHSKKGKRQYLPGERNRLLQAQKAIFE